MKKKTTAAKPVVAAKAARAPGLARLQQQVVQLQHQVASLKHPAAAKAKHKAAKSSGKHGTKRGLALSPDDVACCAAQAVTESLRLAGGSAGGADMLILHGHAAGSPDAAASIWDALKAAQRHGLAGVRPVGFRSLDVHGDPWRVIDEGAPGIILGLGLEAGPHAVFDDGRSWWSWGEPWDVAGFLAAFGPAVIEEAWAVTW